MKSIIPLLILFFCLPIFAQTVIPPGPVEGTWPVSGSPFVIMGDIGIPSGKTLVVEPGVTVEFQGHYNFFVEGQLLAEGSYNDTILFTIYDSTGFHDITIPNGGWGGMRFGSSTRDTDTSRVSYCLFAFGKANGATYIEQQGGAIAASDYSHLVITHTMFYKNAALSNGGAIAVHNSDITIQSSYFWYNSATNGGAIASNSSDIILKQSTLLSNVASNSGGGIALSSNSDGVITSNFIAGNYADFGAGLQFEDNCNSLICNNIIYSNAAYVEGGGTDLQNDCQATFVNNTIVGNYALFGGGVDVELNTSPTFRNDIIRDNTAFVDGPQIHLFSEDSDPDFYYCNVEGGIDSIGVWYGGDVYLNYTGIYENNIDEVPDFITEGYYQFLLNEGSPCIDAGDPDEQYNDLEEEGNPGYAKWPSKGTLRNDMGCYGGPHAFLYDIVTSIDEYLIKSSTDREIILYQNYPNPVKYKTTIAYTLKKEGIVRITLYDLYGKEVFPVLNQKQNKGYHQVELDIHKHNLNPGVYIYDVQFNNTTKSRRMIIH